METKQVIVLRKDLNMRKGKMCAQSAHASESFITKQLKEQIEEYFDNPQAAVHMLKIPFTVELTIEEMLWLRNSFKKIAVSAKDEEELECIAKEAEWSGLTVHRVVDSGLTEFSGTPTFTCIAIGPAEDSKFKNITGDLPLL